MSGKRMVAWCEFVIQVIADLGPEVPFILFHRPRRFTARSRRVRLREQFPKCDPIWVIYKRKGKRWRRAA